MELINNDKNEEIDNIFDNGDFVYMEKIKENGEKEFIGGGYKINSFFLKEGLSPITTQNTGDHFGGKVSSPFENMAVPAGLFYVNMKIPKKDTTETNHYKEHDMISDDIMDKLYSLVEMDKKKRRKTRKYIENKKSVKKTRKQI